ncbi:MAG: primosomal protein N' [Bacteroidota bacterium]
MAQYQFSEIAFPTAVRRLFTYSIPEALSEKTVTGKRVWVPFRSHFAIGVVVRLHNDAPDFTTKSIREVLDSEPLLTQDILEITQWMHRFYYCSWGEVIQAALPAGLNFVSRKKVRVSPSLLPTSDPDDLNLLEMLRSESYTLSEVEKRWKNTRTLTQFRNLRKQGVIEIWEEPDLKISPKTQVAWKITHREKAAQYLAEIGKPNKWQQALQALLNHPDPISAKESKQWDLITPYTISKLKSEGWLTSVEQEVSNQQLLHTTVDQDALNPLNEEQSAAFNTIDTNLSEGTFSSFLLHGITGSGKTEVYIHALNKARSLGKGGIVLVPEIALTPQTVARFRRVFGDDIAVLHSRMSARERLWEWKQLREGRKHIVIGPRSAVFAPVQHIGLIIIDEEHDASYKQDDPAPRYHARETAIMRAYQNHAVVILGSATPSLQALEMSRQEKARKLLLRQRHASAELPRVHLLDMKQYRSAMKGAVLAVPLFQAMEQALARKEQVILLYNRRGFSSYIVCTQCGHIPQSPECAVSLTYHKEKNILLDHYTGYSRKADIRCENCGSTDLEVKGSGTQQVEEQIQQLFPDARILRFDRDSTTGKGAHERILSQFGAQQADILIGTQLVAKGLDFPNVTVVGVVDADTELAFPSFQASERMYQLISQVAGRPGRGTKPGQVFIQTLNPEHPALQFARNHDYDGFAEQERSFRQALHYPPFSRLIRFVFKGKNESMVAGQARRMTSILERAAPQLSLLGPSPSTIPWMNQNYFWELLVKIEPTRGDQFIAHFLDSVTREYEKQAKQGASAVRLNINVDAIR